MRIITGKAKGRRLMAVPGDGTRPISDRVKTALFSIIRPHLSDSVWLDLFGGSGSVGLDALSQGAKHCTFVEINSKAVETIKKNAELTGLSSDCKILRTDAFLFLKNTSHSYDFIYVDPPQFQGLSDRAVSMIAEKPELLTDNACLIVKMHPDEYSELALTHLKLNRQEKYGNSLLLFYGKNFP